MLVTKRESEHYYPQQVDVERKRREKLYEKRKRERIKFRSRQKLLGISFAIIGMILSLFILIGYVNITKIRHEITELENQKTELNREKEDLVAELEGIKSPVKMEEDARIKLGMDYPLEEQVVYVDVEQLNFAANENSRDIADASFIVQRFKNIFNLLLGLF